MGVRKKNTLFNRQSDSFRVMTRFIRKRRWAASNLLYRCLICHVYWLTACLPNSSCHWDTSPTKISRSLFSSAGIRRSLSLRARPKHFSSNYSAMHLLRKVTPVVVQWGRIMRLYGWPSGGLRRDVVVCCAGIENGGCSETASARKYLTGNNNAGAWVLSKDNENVFLI